MLWATALKAVTKGVAAGTYDRSVHLEAIYLFAFQVGIVPANAFCWSDCVLRCFLFRYNSIVYTEVYWLRFGFCNG